MRIDTGTDFYTGRRGRNQRTGTRCRRNKCATLAGFLKYVHFELGTSICRLGEFGETMYFIEMGEVAFYTHDAVSEEKVFRTLGPGVFFGEVAVLSRGFRSANARARTEVFAWELHRDDLPAFVAVCSTMTMNLMKEMAHRLETSGAMLEHTVTPSMAQKIDESRTDTEKGVAWLVRNVGGIPFLIANVGGSLLWILVNKFQSNPIDNPGIWFSGALSGL